MLPCSQDIHILEGCHKDIMIQFQSLTINRLIIVRYIGWWYYYCYILWDESLNSKHSITAPASQLSQPARQNWNWDKIGNSAKLKHFLFFYFQSTSTFILKRFLKAWNAPSEIVSSVICFMFPISIYIGLFTVQQFWRCFPLCQPRFGSRLCCFGLLCKVIMTISLLVIDKVVMIAGQK